MHVDARKCTRMYLGASRGTWCTRHAMHAARKARRTRKKIFLKTWNPGWKQSASSWYMQTHASARECTRVHVDARECTWHAARGSMHVKKGDVIIWKLRYERKINAGSVAYGCKLECPVQLQVEFYADSYVGSRLRLPRQGWLNASFTYLWLVTSLTSLLSGNTTRDSKYDNIRRIRCSITKPTEKSDSPRNSDLFEKKNHLKRSFFDDSSQ